MTEQQRQQDELEALFAETMGMDDSDDEAGGDLFSGGATLGDELGQIGRIANDLDAAIDAAAEPASPSSPTATPMLKSILKPGQGSRPSSGAPGHTHALSLSFGVLG